MSHKEVVSLFKEKHFPSKVSQLIPTTFLQTFEKLGDTQFWAALETAQITLTETNLSVVRNEGVILYPGRHPETKHPMQLVEDRNIALYKLEDSPWNTAVVSFIMSQLNVLSGNQDIHSDTYFADLRTSELKIKDIKTVGVVGAGNIGGNVVRQSLLKFEKVLYTSNSPKEDLEDQGGTWVPLDRLFAEADVVIVTLPKTVNTVGMISTELLGLLKPNSSLISVSAAGVLDENAVVEHLKNSDTTFVLDTFFGEHTIESSLFNPKLSEEVATAISKAKLLLTPHIAYKADGATERLVSALTVPLLEMIRSGSYADSYTVDTNTQEIARSTQQDSEGVFKITRAV